MACASTSVLYTDSLREEEGTERREEGGRKRSYQSWRGGYGGKTRGKEGEKGRDRRDIKENYNGGGRRKRQVSWQRSPRSHPHPLTANSSKRSYTRQGRGGQVGRGGQREERGKRGVKGEEDVEEMRRIKGLTTRGC